VQPLLKGKATVPIFRGYEHSALGTFWLSMIFSKILHLTSSLHLVIVVLVFYKFAEFND